MNAQPLRTVVATATWTLAALLGFASSACRPQPDGAGEQAADAPAAPPPAPPLSDGAGPWTLRYFAAASGELQAARTVAEVPEGSRAQVLVTYDDPKLQGPWVYVADVSRKQGDGYAVRAVPRTELEAQRTAAQAAAQPPAATPPSPSSAPPSTPSPAAAAAAGTSGAAPAAAAAADRDVIIYRTAWCGYCKKAAEYLRLKGVAFVEKDIEADPAARQDMVRRARAAGFPPERLQGVPILAVRGRIIPGFDRGAIDRALAGG